MRKRGSWSSKNNFYLQRGDYDLATVLEESVSDEPFTVEGCLIDLFDPKLPIYTSKRINPGEQALLLNVERVAGKKEAAGSGFGKSRRTGRTRKRPVLLCGEKSCRDFKRIACAAAPLS